MQIVSSAVLSVLYVQTATLEQANFELIQGVSGIRLYFLAFIILLLEVTKTFFIYIQLHGKETILRSRTAQPML